MMTHLLRIPVQFLSKSLPLILLVCLCYLPPASAQQPQDGFSPWLQQLKTEALATGIKRTTLDTALSDVQFLPWVIKADRRQPEFKKSLADYLAGAVSKTRIKQGRRMLKQNRSLLNRIAEKYQVQPRFLVALWGIETNYGRNTGKVPVFSALATMAYDARRSSYFRMELLNALRILDSGQLTKEQMLGSWAGAMGQLQFMPSTFLNYAVDGNGDGRIDLWKTREDYLASAANYLNKSGWQWRQKWGREVSIPEGFAASGPDLDSQLSLETWQKYGIKLKNGGNLPASEMAATLIMPEGIKGDAYLVYDNYWVLRTWNKAHSFALAVGMLADRLVVKK